MLAYPVAVSSVLLLLFAFLKPVLPQRSLAAPGAAGQRHAVILILDASLSMRHTAGGVSPFARARMAAEKIIDDLGPNDRAALTFAGATPVVSSAAEAVRQLSRVSGVQPEIHFLSDFQRDNWAAVKFTAIPPEVKVVFVPVGTPDAGNLAVTDVMLQPAAPAAGEDVDILAKIANYSAVDRQVTLELRFGDDTRRARDVSLPAGMTVTTGFRVSSGLAY